ncbi:MAG: phosphoribosylaminoimidazolesuccinocarboxamide synthase [Patescibacteria group bacterium]|nr:phosphoribosylaminoimidazolesuccinocarboxamide synthase [Patescibacteria group bacterium]
MNLVPVGHLVAEGKTKKIYADPKNEKMVLIRSKDAITAGDGAKRDEMTDKARYSTQTARNCFRLLESAGIPTHFVDQVDDVTFRALRLRMIPIELVARRIAFGSFLERCPMVKRGQQFEQLRTEFFYKDDARHDPLMLWDTLERCFYLYRAHQPLFGKDSYLGSLSVETLAVPFSYQELQGLLEETFLTLERALAKLDLVILDLKIEVGQTGDGRLVVGDILDSDSWRICLVDKFQLVIAGDSSQLLDKQTFRDGSLTMEGLKANYALVAEMTKKFVDMV